MYKVPEHIVWRSKQNLLVVLDTESGHYYNLNETAQDLWFGLFEKDKSLEEIVSQIREAYDKPPSAEQITRDCQKMIDSWVENGLIIKE